MIRTSDFDYSLPEEFIAQSPIEPRDKSRLMIVHKANGSLEHRRFYEIVDLLQTGDVLVLNDSRVIPARIRGRRRGGGKVEMLLLRSLEKGIWEALVKPARYFKVGDKIEVVNSRGESAEGSNLAEVLGVGDMGLRTIRFTREELLEGLGQTPLPPYIHAPLLDPERYQTVYAREKGSVAAPTAGLHFTTGLLDRLKDKGVELAFVTLHVGLDTFRPIRVEDPRQHSIHKEYGELSREMAEKISKAKAEGRRIICVGTTAVRVLEQAALVSNFEVVDPFRGWVSLFILPGHKFRLVDGLITNFHLPRSTLLMLVSAFAGQERIKNAYKQAIESGYRFYSFGDAMFIVP